MYRIFILLLISISLFSACKKEQKPEEETEKTGKKSDTPIGTKCAKYKVSVYKTKDLQYQSKNYLAILNKGEIVKLYEEIEFTIMATKKPKEIILAKIQLDNENNDIGYIEARHLADKSIVFTSDTDAHVRPNERSKVYTSIPKGTLGFIIGEKGNWVKIYIGKINDKWVTKQWVDSGYSSEDAMITAALKYDEILDMIKAGKNDEAKKLLEEIASDSEGLELFKELANEKITELNEGPSTEESGDSTNKSPDKPEKKPAEEKVSG